MENGKEMEKATLEELKKEFSTGAVSRESYKHLFELVSTKNVEYTLAEELNFLKKMRKSEKERAT